MHRVLVDYAGVPIGGSPYSVQVFDASLVKVSKIGQGFLGKPATFTCKLAILFVSLVISVEKLGFKVARKLNLNTAMFLLFNTPSNTGLFFVLYHLLPSRIYSQTAIDMLLS